jgi:c-di-GMP-binding flagellar brake protein YcgR
MADEKDRREIERVEIPNGSVYYKPDAHLNLLNRYAGPEVLIDISKSGAGFIVSHDLNRNENIRVKLMIPGEKDITLQGYVKWITSAETSLGKNRVGIQFLPFGYHGKYNAIDKLKKLGSIEFKFQ